MMSLMYSYFVLSFFSQKMSLMRSRAEFSKFMRILYLLIQTACLAGALNMKYQIQNCITKLDVISVLNIFSVIDPYNLEE